MQATKYIRNPYEKFMLAFIPMLIKGMKNPGLCRGFPICGSDCGGGGSLFAKNKEEMKSNVFVLE